MPNKLTKKSTKTNSNTLRGYFAATSGLTSVQTALGFGAAAFVAALFLTPMLDTGSQRVAYFGSFKGGQNIDPITTATTRKGDVKTKRYTIRRSVLQKNPSEPCIIYETGLSEGDC